MNGVDRFSFMLSQITTTPTPTTNQKPIKTSFSTHLFDFVGTKFRITCIQSKYRCLHISINRYNAQRKYRRIILTSGIRHHRFMIEHTIVQRSNIGQCKHHFNINLCLPKLLSTGDAEAIRKYIFKKPYRRTQNSIVFLFSSSPEHSLFV